MGDEGRWSASTQQTQNRIIMQGGLAAKIRIDVQVSSRQVPFGVPWSARRASRADPAAAGRKLQPGILWRSEVGQA